MLVSPGERAKGPLTTIRQIQHSVKTFVGCSASDLLRAEAGLLLKPLRRAANAGAATAGRRLAILSNGWSSLFANDLLAKVRWNFLLEWRLRVGQSYC
jgi:hypothetical protein